MKRTKQKKSNKRETNYRRSSASAPRTRLCADVLSPLERGFDSQQAERPHGYGQRRLGVSRVGFLRSHILRNCLVLACSFLLLSAVTLTALWSVGRFHPQVLVSYFTRTLEGKSTDSCSDLPPDLIKHYPQCWEELDWQG